jgi:hypothetical protein
MKTTVIRKNAQSKRKEEDFNSSETLLIHVIYRKPRLVHTSDRTMNHPDARV